MKIAIMHAPSSLEKSITDLSIIFFFKKVRFLFDKRREVRESDYGMFCFEMQMWAIVFPVSNTGMGNAPH